MTRSRKRPFRTHRTPAEYRAHGNLYVSWHRLEHLQKRALERYGVLLTRESCDALCEDIRGGRAEHVRDLPHGAQAWRSWLGGVEVIVAADTKGCVLTFLLAQHRQLADDEFDAENWSPLEGESA